MPLYNDITQILEPGERVLHDARFMVARGRYRDERNHRVRRSTVDLPMPDPEAAPQGYAPQPVTRVPHNSLGVRIFGWCTLGIGLVLLVVIQLFTDAEWLEPVFEPPKPIVLRGALNSWAYGVPRTRPKGYWWYLTVTDRRLIASVRPFQRPGLAPVWQAPRTAVAKLDSKRSLRLGLADRQGILTFADGSRVWLASPPDVTEARLRAIGGQ